MLIISVDIIKTIDERERCDTRCDVMRLSLIKAVKNANN